MNILRTITADKKFLYNVVYTNKGLVDTLAIHMLGPDNCWSPSLPLCSFPQEDIELMVNSIQKTLRNLISSRQDIKNVRPDNYNYFNSNHTDSFNVRMKKEDNRQKESSSDRQTKYIANLSESVNTACTAWLEKRGLKSGWRQQKDNNYKRRKK